MIISDEGTMGEAGSETSTAKGNIGVMTEVVGVVEPATEPARKVDEANGAPSAAQTVGMNDGQ